MHLRHKESVFIIELIYSPCLRSLTIQFWRYRQTPRYLAHLLSQVVSCEMEEIAIGLLLAYDELDVMDWNCVKSTLAQPQFSKLRTFRICTNSNQSAWFIDHLPRGYARDILSIQWLRWALAIL
jgi:hypothetical protein